MEEDRLTDEEWWKLFCTDWPQLKKIIDVEYRNGSRACYKCFRSHSIAKGHYNEIPNYWFAL